MKNKTKCATCGKKMFFRKEIVGHYVCKRCGYPDTEKIKVWQKRHKEARKPRNVYRIVIDKLTGKKLLYTRKEE